MAVKAKQGVRRVVIYVRVSRMNGRAEGDASFHATEMQIAEAEKGMARRHNLKVVEVIVELDASAKRGNPRPKLERALRMIENREADVILSSTIDRLGRSTSDIMKILDRTRDAGGSMILGEPYLDSADKSSELVITVLAAVAQWELRQRTERWEMVTERVTKAGRRIGSAPTGYLLIELRRLVPDPATAHLIPLLFEKRAARWSYAELRDWWEAETGRRLAPSTITGMIGNRTYLGEMHYGDDLKLTADELGEHAHKPLITLDQFNAAQSTEAPRPSRAKEPTAMLTGGVLHCGNCGGAMTAAGGGRGSHIYRCSTRGTVRTPCKGGATINQEILDRWVEAQFLAHYAEVEAEVIVDDVAELRAAEKVLAEAKAEKSAYLTFAKAIDAEMFQVGLDARDEAIGEAAAVLAGLKTDNEVASLHLVVGDDWPTFDLAEKRRLIQAGIKSITVHRFLPTAPGEKRGPLLPVDKRATITWR